LSDVTRVTNDIVAKLWTLCHILRDDGITYNEYVTELTFLLFLKMLQERDLEGRLPPDYRWAKLASATGEPIAVELRPAAPADDALDRLAALAIECRRARFTIARDDTPNCAVARSEIDCMQPIQRKVRLERLDEADLIGEELRLLGHDKTFEAVLQVTAGMLH